MVKQSNRNDTEFSCPSSPDGVAYWWRLAPPALNFGASFSPAERSLSEPASERSHNADFWCGRRWARAREVDPMTPSLRNLGKIGAGLLIVGILGFFPVAAR